jgi:ribonuclease BN (tRNA processing enzyme)
MADGGEIVLKVLGAAGGYPYGGHACSGYLIETAGSRILLDCGPGVAARLLAMGRAIDLDAIVVTHIHPDHTLDLIAVGYALMQEWIKHRVRHRVRLAMPEGGAGYLERLSGLFGHTKWTFSDDDLGPGFSSLRTVAREGRDWMFDVFDVVEFVPGARVDLDGIAIDTLPVDHIPGAVALRLDHGGKRLVYSGDTRWHAPLVEFASGADLLVAEGHFSGSHPPGGAHMSPAEAGRLARLSGARQLLLTHLAALEDGPSALAAARAECAAPVRLAVETSSIRL